MLSDLKRVPLGWLVKVLLIPLKDVKDDIEYGAGVATSKLESLPVIQLTGNAGDISILVDPQELSSTRIAETKAVIVGLCVPKLIAGVLPRSDMDFF
jgi:hypothetical protein